MASACCTIPFLSLGNGRDCEIRLSNRPFYQAVSRSMLIFFYLLAALGVAYWAKLDGRNPALWFAASVALTPLGASIALMICDRYSR